MDTSPERNAAARRSMRASPFFIAAKGLRSVDCAAVSSFLASLSVEKVKEYVSFLLECTDVYTEELDAVVLRILAEKKLLESGASTEAERTRWLTSCHFHEYLNPHSPLQNTQDKKMHVHVRYGCLQQILTTVADGAHIQACFDDVLRDLNQVYAGHFDSRGIDVLRVLLGRIVQASGSVQAAVDVLSVRRPLVVERVVESAAELVRSNKYHFTVENHAKISEAFRKAISTHRAYLFGDIGAFQGRINAALDDAPISGILDVMRPLRRWLEVGLLETVVPDSFEESCALTTETPSQCGKKRRPGLVSRIRKRKIKLFSTTQSSSRCSEEEFTVAYPNQGSLSLCMVLTLLLCEDRKGFVKCLLVLTLWLCACGACQLDKQDIKQVELFKKVSETVPALADVVFGRVPSLKQICVCSVRCCLQGSIADGCSKLPLPVPLQKYIASDFLNGDLWLIDRLTECVVGSELLPINTGRLVEDRRNFLKLKHA